MAEVTWKNAIKMDEGEIFRAILLRNKQTSTNQSTSTSVFRDEHLSTHDDPMHAKRIGKRMGHAYNQAPYELHTQFYCSGGEMFPKNVRFPAQNDDEPPCKIWCR